MSGTILGLSRLLLRAVLHRTSGSMLISLIGLLRPVGGKRRPAAESATAADVAAWAGVFILLLTIVQQCSVPLTPVCT